MDKGKEEEVEPDYHPQVNVDFAPTEIYASVKGMEETLRQAEQYARNSSTRHFPFKTEIPPPEPKPVDVPRRALTPDEIKLVLAVSAMGILFLGVYIGYKLK